MQICFDARRKWSGVNSSCLGGRASRASKPTFDTCMSFVSFDVTDTLWTAIPNPVPPAVFPERLTVDVTDSNDKVKFL